MKRCFYQFLLTISILIASPHSITAAISEGHLKMLFNGMDPTSVAQHLAFFSLYPTTKEGQNSLEISWKLLSQQSSVPLQGNVMQSLQVTQKQLGLLVDLVNRPPGSAATVLSDDTLRVLNYLSQSLAHRRLRGHNATTEEQVLLLPSEEIDLARGLLLSELGPDNLPLILSYEALLDLMACQVRATLCYPASDFQKIEALNHFIFEEMHFRFPAHSLYSKDIDLYTFLPSVLDSRRGVCLGVSILYLCLAQRLDLPLEMITPPGHIYVRYRKNGKEINIETTARGIHLNSEEYLSLSTRSLQLRNIKEVIGMAHMNQAAVHWGKEDYNATLNCYKKAKPYLEGDPLLQELMAYAQILSGNVDEGTQMLKSLPKDLPDHLVIKDTMAEDFLLGNVDVDGIKTVFQTVDEKRESVLQKRDRLQKVVERCPKFRHGWFSLAITWLQLNRYKEAVEVLTRFQRLDPSDPTAEYYLAVLHAERWNYPKAWIHLENAERIVAARDYYPRQLKELKRELKKMTGQTGSLCYIGS